MLFLQRAHRSARKAGATFPHDALARFSADRTGATLVEFAMVTPPLLFLLLGICQTGLIFLAGLSLDNATTVLGREIRTGQAQGKYANVAAVRAALCGNALGLIDCSGDKLLIDVQRLSGPVSLGWPVDEKGEFRKEDAYSPGNPRDLILVRVFYRTPVLIPMFAAALSDMPDGHRLLVSSLAFRNEPFTVATPPAKS